MVFPDILLVRRAVPIKPPVFWSELLSNIIDPFILIVEASDKIQMLHFLQTVLRSFHRCRANVKKPKSNIMYIATRGPPVMLKRAVTIITMYNFNARNTVDKVILFKEKFVEQVAHWYPEIMPKRHCVHRDWLTLISRLLHIEHCFATGGSHWVVIIARAMTRNNKTPTRSIGYSITHPWHYYLLCLLECLIWLLFSIADSNFLSSNEAIRIS